MGKLRGDDEIMCGYHGICYDPDGRATFMPAQETINPSATVHSFPAVERHRYVCIWPGDPADRKSTRLNSSHANTSYAVFCLKTTNTRSTLPVTECPTVATHPPSGRDDGCGAGAVSR